MNKTTDFSFLMGITAMVGMVGSLNADMSLNDSGITFPDGSFQSTAFSNMYTAPDAIFRSGCSVSKSTATSIGRCTVERSIPAGKRLVIETVTGSGSGDNYYLGTAYISNYVPDGSDAGGITVHYGFPWVIQTPSFGLRHFIGFSFSGHIYVDGPNTLQFNVRGASASGSTTNYSIDYAISGYLVDLAP